MSTLASSNESSALCTLQELRRRAESLIETNAIPSSIRAALGTDVLALLYSIASSPTGGSEVLKLLHEFQVYQVELDLQFKQLQENEQELTNELVYYRSLFRCAPAGYLVTSSTGQITDGNKAAANLLGVELTELCDFSMDSFVEPNDISLLQQQLKALEDETATVQRSMTLNCRKRGLHPFLIIANLTADGESFHIMLLPAE